MFLKKKKKNFKVFSFYKNTKKNINVHIKFAHSNQRNFKFEKQALEVTIEYVIFLNLTKPKILAEYIQKQAHTYWKIPKPKGCCMHQKESTKACFLVGESLLSLELVVSHYLSAMKMATTYQKRCGWLQIPKLIPIRCIVFF